MIRYTLLFLVYSFTFLSVPFKVIQSEQERYFTGRRESGGGVNYQILLIVDKPSKKLTFETLNVGDKKLEIKLFDAVGNKIQQFFKGDTICLKASLKFNAEDLQVSSAGNFYGITYLHYTLKSKCDSIKIIIEQSVVKNRF
jgi:hypothetical protein